MRLMVTSRLGVLFTFMCGKEKDGKEERKVSLPLYVHQPATFPLHLPVIPCHTSFLYTLLEMFDGWFTILPSMPTVRASLDDVLSVFIMFNESYHGWTPPPLLPPFRMDRYYVWRPSSPSLSS